MTDAAAADALEIPLGHGLRLVLGVGPEPERITACMMRRELERGFVDVPLAMADGPRAEWRLVATGSEDARCTHALIVRGCCFLFAREFAPLISRELALACSDIHVVDPGPARRTPTAPNKASRRSRSKRAR